MKTEKRKKTSKDYEYKQYSFRVPERKKKQFEDVESKIERVRLYQNHEVVKEEERKLRTADVLIEALDRGLDALLKEYKIPASYKPQKKD